MSPFTSDLNGSSNNMNMMSYADSMPLMARGNASDNANRNNSNMNNNNNSNNNESDNSSGCDNMSLLSRCRRNISMGASNLMSYQNMLVMLTVLVCGLATVNGLKCHMCGQYNEGVGSITPCLNYSDQYAHLYLKECSKKSEKYCVKYVSELSTVRDCATECVEKEIWETQTYCCNTDGCNGSNILQISKPLLLLPLIYGIYKALTGAFNERH
ncbi:TNF receptor-associated factor family protein DDB_G0272348 [Bactrocera dorsalis]|uniref:TNF receptor-associated factor family protein DDB_G0272348 n=1 Tax=Bactrocera dorsalis TaxID=27457 RepID=A0ABM3JBA7_BACDO|nr:TNF receptor-associated factor family protein DDB_G0272348 [Bactrocera dorsalis]XP_049306505.1 TNF receptor-associated factor family protein DDB_G0272348 [Bactrocera dorsalis]XP_049306506.1 TNF receptor-associated factor family protein DDB_G0272348 [Bactrocera dorsalis]